MRPPPLQVALTLALLAAGCARGRASGPLPHDAYVWQRAWTPAVREAVERTAGFRSLVVLAAEVDLSERPPRVARPAIGWDALRTAGRPVGLALRIGRFQGWGAGTGRFADDPETVRLLSALAAEAARTARAERIEPVEIQLDYDCPESQLADYPVLIRAVRGTLGASIPVTVTALPSWLRHRDAWLALARTAGGVVLQVHFLRAPSGETGLIDPREAVRAVEQAAAFGLPFRVALPTYGYGVVLDERGGLVGLSAEGGPRRAPSGASSTEISADPTALAGLVRGWTRDRPRELAGLVWYRLPVAGDVRNWPPETLRAVMAGRAPRAEVGTAVRFPRPGLAEVDLLNTGEAEASMPSPLPIRWDSDKLVAADAIAGYRLLRTGPRAARLEAPAPRLSLRPGERRTVAWLRFTGPTEVHVEIPSPAP